MTKSAIRASFLWTALFFCTACERSPAHVDEKAQEAWELYRRRPDELSFRNFIGVNRKAANEHDRPHDATGVEYQLRACEVMTMEAERLKDATLAADVLDAIADIERRDLLDAYDEALPGAKKRFIEVKSRASAVSR